MIGLLDTDADIVWIIGFPAFLANKTNGSDIQLHRKFVHQSLLMREDELAYLKQLCVKLYPYILPEANNNR